jgi:hypothetical protein
MALDNQREDILVSLIAQLNSVSAITKVQRRRPTSEEFQQMSDHQFPFVAMEAMGPQPLKIIQEARKGFGSVLVHHFSMSVDFYVYARWVTDQDTEFGDLYDDIYRAIYTDELLKNLADSISTEPVPSPTVVMEPYYLFRIRSKVNYRTPGGI